jgi:DNA-directed RNA polymerase omega subunit
MAYVPIEQLYKKVGSMYKLVIVASRRAVELSEGASKLVEANGDTKAANIALQEIQEGKISFKKEKEKE